MRQGTACPSFKISTTQGSAPLPLKAHHRRDKQPPITTGQGPWLRMRSLLWLEAGEEPQRGDFLFQEQPREEALSFNPPVSEPLPLLQKPEVEAEKAEEP